MLVNSSINASGAYSRLSLGYRRFGMGPILAIPQAAAAACLKNGHVTKLCRGHLLLIFDGSHMYAEHTAWPRSEMEKAGQK